jgi:uncharacterized SAM-binding protein YcdF (DUF218 family)
VPVIEFLILLTVLGIAWLISPRRWRRRVIQPVLIGALIYGVATSPLGVNLALTGLTFSLPQDSGGAVDAIVVLGRGEDLRYRRVELAKQLWQEGRASQIFISGMLDAQPIVEILKEVGVPGQILKGESCSQTTEENALYTSAILRPQGVQKILLITDPAHMLRSFLLFRSLEFIVLPYSSPMPPQWSSQQQMIFIVREYLALAKYAFTGRFKQRPDSGVKKTDPEIFEKFSAWNCRIEKA